MTPGKSEVGRARHRVLARDENGRASAWIKGYGGPPGSGFVRVWGREEPPADLAWVERAAELEAD